MATMILSKSSSAGRQASTMFCCSAFLQSLTSSSFSSLVFFCAGGRANFTFGDSLFCISGAASSHAIWTCLVKILRIGSAVSEAAKKAVTLLDQGHSSPSITAVRDSKEWLEAAGFGMSSWEVLALGAGDCGHSATSRMAAPSISELRRQFTEPERVLMLSEGGPMAVEPFSSFPTSRETRFDSQPSNMNRRSRRLWYAQTSRFSSLSEKKGHDHRSGASSPSPNLPSLCTQLPM